VLHVELGPEGHRWRRRTRLKRYGFFLRAETAFGLMATVEGVPGYWEQQTSLMSHGEGFLTVFDAMFRSPGTALKVHNRDGSSSHVNCTISTFTPTPPPAGGRTLSGTARRWSA